MLLVLVILLLLGCVDHIQPRIMTHFSGSPQDFREMVLESRMSQEEIDRSDAKYQPLCAEAHSLKPD